MPSLTAHAVCSFSSGARRTRRDGVNSPGKTVKSIRSGAGVETIVDDSQPCLEDVRVDLRRRYIGVAEHQLNGPQVSAALEQVRRERMAEHVRADRRRQIGAARVVLQDLPEADAAQRAAARVEEQPR